MPIYEYRCQQCGHELERIQKMSDEPLRECPACQESALKRLVSAAVFRLKGGGWYETDFKQGQKRNIADSGNESPDSKESSKTADSKPEKVESGNADSGKADSGKADSGKAESGKAGPKPAKKEQASTG